MVCRACLEVILRTDWLRLLSLKPYCDGCLRVQHRPPQEVTVPFFHTHTVVFMTFFEHPVYDHWALSLRPPPWEIRDWLFLPLEALACALALTYEDGWVLMRALTGDDEAKIQDVQEQKLALLQ